MGLSVIGPLMLTHNSPKIRRYTLSEMLSAFFTSTVYIVWIVSHVFVCEPCSVGSGLSAVMAILFAVVARGSTVLAKHACFTGNFLEVTEQILAKIPSENNKLTYSHGRCDWHRAALLWMFSDVCLFWCSDALLLFSSYLFHYICHERIVYLCITDDVSVSASWALFLCGSAHTLSCPSLLQEFERSRAFGFLNEVKKRFQTTYGSRAQTALPYAMNSEFSSTLAAQMVRASAVFVNAISCSDSFMYVCVVRHKMRFSWSTVLPNSSFWKPPSKVSVLHKNILHVL